VNAPLSVAPARHHDDLFAEVARVCAERMANDMADRLRGMFEALRADAELDALTGLFNRRRLDRCLPQELAESRRAGAALVLALIDVDHFGRINKEYGWPSGDRVLAEVARRLRDSIRSNDWVARYGGDEFCVILRAVTLDEACAILGRVRATIGDEPIAITGDATCQVTVSIGVAELAIGNDRNALLERTSELLLAAKRFGRDQLRAQAN